MRRKTFLSRELLIKNSLGFYAVWVSFLGKRYGLFEGLRRQRRTPRALARRFSLNEAAVSAWCRAAAALGLIGSGRQGEYFLSAQNYKSFADDQSLEYFGSQYAYLALRSLDYDTFDAFFASGKTQNVNSPHLKRAFAAATAWDHTAFFEIFLAKTPELRKLLARRSAVLDVGCGTGEWALRVAGQFPQTLLTGIDPDAGAVAEARKKARELGLDNRVRFRVSSAEAMGFREGSFDAVYLGEVLCMAQRRAEVLRQSVGALKPGGFAVVVEGLRTGHNGEADNRLLDAMQLDFALHGSGFLEKTELRDYMVGAGLEHIRFNDAGGGLWFAAGRRY